VRFAPEHSLPMAWNVFVLDRHHPVLSATSAAMAAADWVLGTVTLLVVADMRTDLLRRYMASGKPRDLMLKAVLALLVARSRSRSRCAPRRHLLRPNLG